MERDRLIHNQSEVSSLPRRTFLFLLGGASLMVVGGSTVGRVLGSSVLGQSTGLGGYHIYTVSNGYPTVDSNKYRLSLFGNVNNPLSLHLNDLEAIGRSSVETTFHCVTGWEVQNQIFSGVLLSKLISLSRPKTDARYVKFTSFDKIYTESLRLDAVMGSDVLVATHMNGVPLSVAHGAPVRLFVPGSFGYKSIKWLSGIELLGHDITGYWEQYGYPADARIR